MLVPSGVLSAILLGSFLAAANGASVEKSRDTQERASFIGGRTSKLLIESVNGTQFCLQVDAFVAGTTPGAAARQVGAVVDVWSCGNIGTMQCNSTDCSFFDHAIVDHFVFTAVAVGDVGSIRSDVSGLCLTVNVNASVPEQVVQGDCSKLEAQWIFGADSQLHFANDSDLCLVVDWSSLHSGVIAGQGAFLQLRACTSSVVPWGVVPVPLVTYPVPEPSWAVDLPFKFKVWVQSSVGDSRLFPSYVGLSEPHFPKSQKQFGKTMSWTTFSFDDTEATSVRVTVVPTTSWSSCEIRPKSLGIICVRGSIPGSASFNVSRANTKVSVEFDPAEPSDPTRALTVVPNALMVFADPLEDPIPDPMDPTVVFFPPGQFVVKCMRLKANTTVYLSGGAWLVGAMQTLPGTHNVTVRGRGTITLDDQRDSDHEGCPKFNPDDKKPPGLLFLCGGLNLSVEGIAAVATPECVAGHIGVNVYWHGCDVDSDAASGARISNVKVMGWSVGANALYSGRYGYVTDSFVRANDDVIPDPDSNSLWERITFWQLDNGWAFMMQWNTVDKFDPTSGSSNVTLRDSVVVHSEQIDNDYGSYSGVRAVFGLWQEEPKPSTIGNFTLSNVHVEGGVWTRLFMVRISPGPFGPSTTCCGNGSVKNFAVLNVSSELVPHHNSWFKGDADENGIIDGVTVSNLMIDSKLMKSPADAGFDFDSTTVTNVKWT